MALLTLALLTLALLTMAQLTMALLTMALLTMALLTMALLTMARGRGQPARLDWVTAWIPLAADGMPLRDTHSAHKPAVLPL